jgi:uncharacterized protein (DUF2249 family)
MSETMPAADAAPPPNDHGTVTLDVRLLLARGESPCGAIEEAAGQVAVGRSLVLLVPFEPVPLYARLARQGFEAQSEPLEDGTWQVTFERVAPAAIDFTPAGATACGCSHG